MDARNDTLKDVPKEVAKNTEIDNSKTIVTIDTDSSIYYEALRQAYEQQDEFFSRPNAPIVLQKLLQRYIDRQSEPTFILFSHQLNHVAFAKTCQEKLKSGDVSQVINMINQIKAMTIGGDFFCMILTFFNAFPEYVKDCDNQVIRNSVGQDFWKKPINDWLTKFMDNHRKDEISNDHEQLERVAAMVPDDPKIACDFADFLLGQMKTSGRHEANRTGLYKGWLCVALSKLADKLPPWKKQAISEELFSKYLTRANTNYSVIGLCQAIASLSSNEDTLKPTANHLRLYVANQLPDLRDEFGSTVNTVSLYMPKVFVAVHQFEKQFSDEVTRKGIIQLITKPENIYPFRTGVAELHDWITQPALQDELKLLFRTLLDHDKFASLFSLFWSWLNNAKGASILETKYFEALNEAKANLETPTNNTAFRECLALLHTNDNILAKDKDYIAKAVARTLDTKNKLGLSARKRVEVHSIMSSLQSWLFDSNVPEAMKLMMASMYYNSENNKQIRISGAKTLFAFNRPSKHVTTIDIKCFRDELLHDLAHDADPEAASALKHYACFADANKLPDLLMCLHTMPDANTTAKLLLSDIREIYFAKLEAQKKLARENISKETVKVAPKSNH